MTPEAKTARKAGKSLIKLARRAAFTALDVYRQEIGANIDFDDDLTNLLTALHHLADNHDLTWKELLGSAKRGYQEDRAHARTPKQAPPPAPLAPPAPGLHPAPYDGPRRADVIAWVRDYLVVHLNQADVPIAVRPTMTELDGWAAQIVDHLVRGMIDRLPPAAPTADPPIQPLHWMVNDRVRLNHPGTAYHGDEGKIVAVTNDAVKVWITGRGDHWFEPSELMFIEGRPATPDEDGDENA